MSIFGVYPQYILGQDQSLTFKNTMSTAMKRATFSFASFHQLGLVLSIYSKFAYTAVNWLICIHCQYNWLITSQLGHEIK